MSKYRSVFISDTHLGFRGCQSKQLLDFLEHIKCDNLYLIGDIIDVWAMKRKLYWPQSHNDILKTLFKLSKKGTNVVFIPGNHDLMFRDYTDNSIGNIAIRENVVAMKIILDSLDTSQKKPNDVHY